MHSSNPIFTFYIGNLAIDLKPEALIQFGVVVFIGILAWWATKDLKFKPNGKKQVVVEYIYTMLQNVVRSNVGNDYDDIIPFISTMGVFLVVMNVLGLVGLPAPTKNFSTTLAMGLISFTMINGYAIKRLGFKHYFGGYAKPVPMMLPINILERVMLPISLAIRLFGNVFAATYLVELVYHALSSIGWIAQIGLPVPLHAYFDVFDGVIQMAIFTMLTMINIKITVEH